MKKDPTDKYFGEIESSVDDNNHQMSQMTEQYRQQFELSQIQPDEMLDIENKMQV